LDFSVCRRNLAVLKRYSHRIAFVLCFCGFHFDGIVQGASFLVSLLPNRHILGRSKQVPGFQLVASSSIEQKWRKMHQMRHLPESLSIAGY
jgi:hypothetical protein